MQLLLGTPNIKFYSTKMIIAIASLEINIIGSTAQANNLNNKLS